MKTAYIIGIIIVILAVVSVAAWFSFQTVPEPPPGNGTCQYDQLNYYYRNDCSHCLRILNEGSLDKLEQLGVQVTKLEVIEWGMYGIYATPTFEFGGQQVKGYKTYDELIQLLGCQPSI